MKSNHMCPRCYKKVFSYGLFCGELLELVCSNASKKILSVYHETQSGSAAKTVVGYLERKGYLVTIDGPDKYIAIKPSRKAVEGVFCWCESDEM